MSNAAVASIARIVATVAAFLLAVHGFGAAYILLHGHPGPFSDNAFKALQLVVGQFPADLYGARLPPSLAVARWALPLLTFWTTLALAWRQVRNPVRLRWIARRGDHLVVAGGEGLAARLLAAERAARRPAMLWADTADAPWVDRLADLGVPCAGGQAGIVALGLDRARMLLLLGDDDARNIALAAAAMEEARRRRPPGDPLPIVVRIDDIDLRHGIEERFAREGDRRSVQPRIVSLPDVAARLLFIDQPLDRFRPIEAGERLVIALGFTPAIERYALRLLASGHFRDGRRPRLLVLAPDAAQKEAVFRARRPSADALSPIVFETAGADQPALLPALLGDVIARHGPSIAILVDVGDDARALACAYAAEGWFVAAGRPSPPIHVRTADGAEEQFGCAIFPFGDAATLADVGELLQDAHDRLAHAIHDAYLDGRLAEGDAIGVRASMQEWDDLPESVRDDNRLVADCYQLKLRDIGARLGPASDVGVHLDDAEIEELARAEHDRWMAAKLVDGWVHGAVRDDRLRRHPDIVPYDDLDEPTRELDRDQIRLMMRLLAQSGQAPRRVLPVRIEAGNGMADRGEVMARLADLYPDRLALMLGAIEVPAVRAMLLRLFEEGMAVQPVLRGNPQALLDTLPPAERAATRRMLRRADTVVALPEGWSEAEAGAWLRDAADLVLTAAEDGRAAATWLA